MTTITLPLLKSRPAWLSSAQGLIGVDVGTCGLKLAQLQQTGSGWRFHTKLQLPFRCGQVLTRDTLLQEGLAAVITELKQAKELFLGRQAAAALPTSLLTLRSFEFPPGPAAELRQMVEQELAEDAEVAASGHEFAAWIGQPGDKADRVIAVSADHEVSLKLAKDLLAARLRTTVLDAAPCALARAVALSDPDNREPAAVLDLGYSTSLFTLVRDGQPLYCRTFRGCGMQALLQAIQTRMQLSAAEAWQLLSRYGVSFLTETSASRAIGVACEGVLSSLVDEVVRTMQFAQTQMRLSPIRLWLVSSGGVIPNLPMVLQTSLELPAAAWQLPGSSDANDALYAVAAGLSAIAWENL